MLIELIENYIDIMNNRYSDVYFELKLCSVRTITECLVSVMSGIICMYSHGLRIFKTSLLNSILGIYNVPYVGYNLHKLGSYGIVTVKRSLKGSGYRYILDDNAFNWGRFTPEEVSKEE